MANSKSFKVAQKNTFEDKGRQFTTGDIIQHLLERRSAFIHYTFIHTYNLLHYYEAGDQANSVELLDDLRFI